MIYWAIFKKYLWPIGLLLVPISQQVSNKKFNSSQPHNGLILLALTVLSFEYGCYITTGFIARPSPQVHNHTEIVLKSFV